MTIKEKYYLKKFAEADAADAAKGALLGGAIGGAGAGAYLPLKGYDKFMTLLQDFDSNTLKSMPQTKPSSLWDAFNAYGPFKRAQGLYKIPTTVDFVKALSRYGTKNPKALLLKSLLGGAGVGSLFGLASSD